MKIYRNIGVLDVRKAKPEAFENIYKFENIGAIISLTNQQELLSHIHQENIAVTISLPADEEVDFISSNGSLKVDEKYLSGLVNPAYFMVNGKMIIEAIENTELLKKIKNILVNGLLFITDDNRPLIEANSQVNGKTITFTAGDVILEYPFEMNEVNLIGLTPGSSIVVPSIIATETIDEMLLKETITRIKILNTLVATRDNLKILMPLIINYSTIDKVIVPDGFVYYKDLTLDDMKLRTMKHRKIFVKNKLTIESSAEDVLKCCDNIISHELVIRKEDLDDIMPIMDKVETIKIYDSEMLENSTVLKLNKAYLEGSNQLAISNYGLLVIEDDVTPELFDEMVKYIENYGKIRCNDSIYPKVGERTRKNFGLITTDKGKSKNHEDEYTIIANMGSLEL